MSKKRLIKRLYFLTVFLLFFYSCTTSPKKIPSPSLNVVQTPPQQVNEEKTNLPLPEKDFSAPKENQLPNQKTSATYQKNTKIETIYTKQNEVKILGYKCPYAYCTLYISTKRGKIHKKIFMKDETISVLLKEEGTYFLKLVKENEEFPSKTSIYDYPIKSTLYDYKIVYDKTKPIVLLKTKNIHKKVFNGNSSLKLCYAVFERHFKNAILTIADSFANKIQNYSDSLPKKKCINYILPSYTTILEFSFKAIDKAENISDTQKIAIFIDASAPTTTFTLPPITNQANITIDYTAFDIGNAGLDFVEAYLSFNNQPFQLIGKSQLPKGQITYKLSQEGKYRVFLKAVDKVGNYSRSEEKEVIFDQSPPTITIGGFNAQAYYADELVNFTLTIQEANPSDNPPKLLFSGEFGKNWQELNYKKEKQHNNF
jgi:hypothetical protein